MGRDEGWERRMDDTLRLNMSVMVCLISSVKRSTEVKQEYSHLILRPSIVVGFCYS